MLEFDQADRLRRALRISSTSVQEMADELDVDRNTVGRYINGRSRPSKATLRVWSLRTGAPLQWLENGTVPGGFDTADQQVSAALPIGIATDTGGVSQDAVACLLAFPTTPSKTSAAAPHVAAATETPERDVVVPMTTRRERLGFPGATARTAAVHSRGPVLATVYQLRPSPVEESA